MTRSRAVTVLGVAFEGLLLGVAWGLGLAVGHSPFATFALEGWAVAWGAAAAAPPLWGAWLAYHSRWGPLQRVKRDAQEHLAPLFKGCSVMQLALLSAAAGLAEEAWFRGVVQAAVGAWAGPAAGLVVASALFGLLHPLSRPYALLAGLIGAYLGAVWLVSGNLLVVVTAHAVYDLVALVFLVRYVRDSSSSS